MRLNFSASEPEEIEEGVRRIGAVVSEQVDLYGAITDHNVPPASSASPPGAAGSAEGRPPGETVVPFRRGQQPR